MENKQVQRYDLNLMLDYKMVQGFAKYYVDLSFWALLPCMSENQNILLRQRGNR